MTRPLNDNITLLVNMITHGSNTMLSEVPIRSGKVRRFTRIAGMYREVEQDILSKEQMTTARIREFEQKVQLIYDTAGVDDLAELPPPLYEQAMPLQQQLVEMRRNLRNIRMQMRQSVDKLGFQLSLVNLFGGPMVVFILAGLWTYRRRRFPTRWMADAL